MFTGIIKEVAKVSGWHDTGNVRRLEIESLKLCRDAAIGDSIAVDGACLTVAEKTAGRIYFDVMEETLLRTSLAILRSGDKVNLEDAVKAGDKLGGHFVLGHIDYCGRIIGVERKENEFAMRIELPKKYGHLVIDKGSVAVNGISLTIAGARLGEFTIKVIPHTLKTTNLGLKKINDSVNIELDVMGKYVAKVLGQGKQPEITEGFLKDKGFI